MSDEEYEKLSPRAKTALRGMGINSAKEFKTPTMEEVLKSRNGGLKTVLELKKLGYIKKTPKKVTNTPASDSSRGISSPLPDASRDKKLKK